MKNETKKLILGTAMAGIFAAGVCASHMTPAFADEGAGGDAKADTHKNSCKGSCKSKNGCKGKKHKKKKGKKADAGAEGGAPAGDAPKAE
jgi:hypothetical protein